MKPRITLTLLALCVLVSSPARAAGDYIWDFPFGGTTLSEAVLFNAVATDTSSNVVIAGQFASGGGGVSFGGAALVSAGGNDVVVAKYNSAGAHQWSKRFGSTGSDVGSGIGTDSSGNVYVIGNFAGTVNFGGSNLVGVGGSDIFLVKLNSSGTHVWSKMFGGTGNENGLAIAVKADGTLAITGSFGNFGSAVDFGGGPIASHSSNTDIFVAKYDTNGNHLWSKGVGGVGSDSGFGVAIDSTGAVIMTGNFAGNVSIGCVTLINAGVGSTTDGLIIRYSSGGLVTWLRRFGSDSDDRGSSVAVNASDEVVVTGGFDGAVTFGGTTRPDSGGGSDIFLAKYSSAGAWMWDSVFGSSAGFGDSTKGVAVDASGNIAITGSMLNGLNFGGGALCPGCGTYDAFIAKFTGAGAHVYSDRFDNLTYDEHSLGVAFDASGNAVIAGDFFDTINLGGGVRTSTGGTDGFIAKFAP